ncbi:hypothetical protein ES703_78186 [subsurface metagenome]
MRKNLLYARRLMGDIGPLNTDPVRRLPGRIIAPAVSITGVYQDYDEVSAVQNYNIGSRMQVDGRTFYYSSAGGTLNCDQGAFNALPQHVGFAALPTALTLAASYTLVVTVGAGDGAAGNGNIALNELFGGYIVIFMPGGESINRQVVGNTAVTGGGDMTVTLDRPLGQDVPNTEHAEILASPYRLVLTMGVGTPRLSFCSVMGMPPVSADINEFLWLQTWGPVWIAPQGGVSVGTLNRRVYFREDGSIMANTPGDPIYADAQYAGYVLANAQALGQGAAFIQLQLSP